MSVHFSSKTDDWYTPQYIIDDVCEVHYRMLESDTSGVFNVGTGSTASFRDVADIIKQRSNCVITEVPMPQELKGQYQKFTKADNSKLLEIIGDYDWQSVEDYVDKNIDAYLN